MTGTATETAPSAAVGTASRGGAPRRSRLAGWRLWTLVGLAVVTAVVATAWLNRPDPQYGGALDPTNPGPDGARAVAEVLAAEGVEVEVARSAEEFAGSAPDEDTTVVVTQTSELGGSTTTDLLERAGDARVVLVEPDSFTVQRIDADLTTAAVVPEELAAACTTDTEASSLPDLDDLELTVDLATAYPGVASGCFGTEQGRVLAALDSARSTDAEVWAFGAGEALSNDQVLRADNAAVALRLLGARDRVVWYVPDRTDAQDEAVTLSSLLPRWLIPSLWLLLVAVLGLVAWRGRRLGPLSTEPLPVVVRAVETTVSRGRMYRRAADQTHAAAALRRQARRRLADRVGLQRPTVAELCGAVAARTDRSTAELAHLLDGPAPTDDQQLIRLAHDLERLTREVR